jgi:hypothetical protein
VTKSSRFDLVEKSLLEQLEDIIENYSKYTPEIKPSTDNISIQGIKNIKNEIDKLKIQKDNLHDLLEQGIYSVDVFLERNEMILSKLETLQNNLATLEKNIQPRMGKREISEALRSAVDTYLLIDDVEIKNQVLKSVISKIIYHKPKASKFNEFSLSIELKI